jgi:hypothetical protein
MTKPTDAFRNFQIAQNELPKKDTNLKPFRRCSVRNSSEERILQSRFEVSRKIMKRPKCHDSYFIYRVGGK